MGAVGLFVGFTAVSVLDMTDGGSYVRRPGDCYGSSFFSWAVERAGVCNPINTW